MHRKPGVASRPVSVAKAPAYTVVALDGKSLTLRRAEGTTVTFPLAKKADVPKGLAPGQSVTIKTRTENGKKVVSRVREAGDTTGSHERELSASGARRELPRLPRGSDRGEEAAMFEPAPAPRRRPMFAVSTAAHAALAALLVVPPLFATPEPPEPDGFVQIDRPSRGSRAMLRFGDGGFS